ncbi:MAG: hypothetical protein UHW97_04380 [Frisingicoccus sp.]|nr:hypothetical protein [Frisingicoccus sp.]
MKEQDIFKRTFDKLHASPDVLQEVLDMAANEKVIPMKKRRLATRAAAVIAVLILVIGSGSVAYAMDIGGIQRMVQVWIHGDQTDAEFIVENGSYTLNYKDEDGNDVQRGGGGIAYENGEERPLTADELLEQMMMPEVEYKEDGTVWVYYMDQKMEITDKFEDEICYVKLEADGQTQYITVKYQDGYATSPHGYIQADELN